MSKALFFATIAACLLASAHPLLPVGAVTGLLGEVTKPLGNITNAVTGTVGQVTGTLTSTVNTVTDLATGLVKVAVTLPRAVTGSLSVNASASGSVGGLGGLTSGLTSTLTSLTSGLGNITSSVGGIVGSVTGLVNPLVDTLTKTLGSVTDSLGPTLESALGQPLRTVTGLLDTVTRAVNPSNISSGLNAALKPALDAVTGLVSQLPSNVGCLVNTAVGNVTSEILKGVAETLRCASPLLRDVNSAAQQVGMVVGDSAQIASGLLSNVTRCALQSVNPPDVGKIVACVTGPVGQGLSQVTGVVGSTTPIVTGTVNSALGVPQCAQKVLSNGLSKANAILSDIVKCVAGKGLNITLPTLPGIGSNYTAVAAKALAAIDEISSAALGPNSPTNALMMAVQKLQNAASNLSPASVNAAVNNTLRNVQASIDAIKENGSSTPEARACVASAQKAVADLAAPAVQGILACAQTIAPDATSVVAQAAALDVGLKTEAARASATALARCAGSALALDNAAERCFDAAVAEARASFMEQLNKINNATQTVNSLTERAEKCLSNGTAQTDKAGQAIVAQLRQCMSGQGVPMENTTAAVIAGRAAVERAVANLTSLVNVATTVSTNVKGSSDFIASIDAETLQQVVGPSVVATRNAVIQIGDSLRDLPNPAVRACIDTSVNRLTQLENTSVQSSVDCVNSNKARIDALAVEAAAVESGMKQNIANAGAMAEMSCKANLTSAGVQNCYANFQANFNADFNQALSRVQSIADQAQMIISDTVDCVNNTANQSSANADNELAMVQRCLREQGVDVTVTRP